MRQTLRGPVLADHCGPMTPEGLLSRMVKIWSRRTTLRRAKGWDGLFPWVFPMLFAGSGEKVWKEKHPDRRTGSFGPAKRTETARVPVSRAEGARGGEA